MSTTTMAVAAMLTPAALPGVAPPPREAGLGGMTRRRGECWDTPAPAAWHTGHMTEPRIETAAADRLAWADDGEHEHGRMPSDRRAGPVVVTGVRDAGPGRSVRCPSCRAAVAPQAEHEARLAGDGSSCRLDAAVRPGLFRDESRQR